jgi:signal transduction histidine kinase
VVGQAQILRRRAPEDAWVAARADAILRAASRMDAMVEDLLDAARLESGRLRLSLERVNLEDFVDELFSRLGTSLEVERVIVNVPRSEGIALDVDPRRLERVIVNLLSNALKFCPEGAVRLAAERRDGWVVLSVSDEGPGIDPVDVPNLFTRYHQGRRTPSRDGIGLGLYGARLLVEAHGGRISVESAPGAGSTFRVELPGTSTGKDG